MLDIKIGTTEGDPSCICVVPRHYDKCKVRIGDRMGLKKKKKEKKTA